MTKTGEKVERSRKKMDEKFDTRQRMELRAGCDEIEATRKDGRVKLSHVGPTCKRLAKPVEEGGFSICQPTAGRIVERLRDSQSSQLFECAKGATAKHLTCGNVNAWKTTQKSEREKRTSLTNVN